MGKFALIDKAAGKNVPASTKRGMGRANASYENGYPVEVDTPYGSFRDNEPFPSKCRNMPLSKPTVRLMKEDAKRENCEPGQKATPFGNKQPETETIAVGNNGKMFKLDEILCIEAHNLGMFPGAEHPFIQETFAKNDYDILKARNELVLYFKNNLWLRITPYIYVKKADAERPLRQLAQETCKQNRAINPEDFGLVLHPTARQILGDVQGDKMQLIFELEPMLSNLPTGIDWQEAEAVMQFLNAFSVNAFFYQLKEMRNNVTQDVMGGRLDAALKAAEKMDCESDREMAFCWIIMGRLNRREVAEAGEILKKIGTARDGGVYWPSLVKATALVAMYHVKNGRADEAEKLFAPLEKMLENRYGAEILIEWQARAGLEGAAIQNLLKYADNYESQDRLFEMLAKIKPFEINPKDFEIR